MSVSDKNCATVEEVNKRIKDGDIYVIDVRNTSEMGPDGTEYINIKNRLHIPFNDFETAIKLDEDAYKQKYGLSKPSKDGSEVLLHCGKGGRSLKALNIMLGLGYDNAKHLPGGYTKWKAETP